MKTPRSNLAAVTIDFRIGPLTSIITGTAYLMDRTVLVDVTDSQGVLFDDARSALTSGVRDGRCKLPPHIRAAIDNGATVL